MATSIMAQYATELEIVNCMELGFSGPTREQGAHLTMAIDTPSDDTITYYFKLVDEGEELLDTIELDDLETVDIDDSNSQINDTKGVEEVAAIGPDEMDTDSDDEMMILTPTTTNSFSDASPEDDGPNNVEDVMMEYMNVAYPCDSSILRRECGIFRQALEGYSCDTANVSFLVGTLREITMLTFACSSFLACHFCGPQVHRMRLS
jgi:hypothetical protein